MADELTPDQPEQHSLVMPFIVCQSNGGTYEDRSFVAGARFGQIDQESKTIADGRQKEWWSEPDLVPQLDLLAMQRGLTMKAEPWEDGPDEWVLVTMSRPTGGIAR